MQSRRQSSPLLRATHHPRAPHTARFQRGLPDGFDLPLDHPVVQRDLSDHGPNQWSVGTSIFEAVMGAYFQEMLRGSQQVLRAPALPFDLAECYFDAFCDTGGVDAAPAARSHPAREALPGEKGCGAHTDWGAVTILLQGDAGGLQVRSRDSGSIDATPIPGSFVVNLRDLTGAGRTTATARPCVALSTHPAARAIRCRFSSTAASTSVWIIPSCLAASGRPAFSTGDSAGASDRDDPPNLCGCVAGATARGSNEAVA
jgi:hypothetical protein